MKTVFVLMFMATRVMGMSGATYQVEHQAYGAKAEYATRAGCQHALAAMNDQLDAFGHPFEGDGYCEPVSVEPGNFIERQINSQHH